MKKKGQAAMEFLMTYGWAILVVLVAIGALAYFGVLNPGRFLPSSCTITPGISCEDFVVNDAGNGEITLTLRNGIGDDITAVSVDITSPDDPTTIICTGGLSCTSGCSGGSLDTMPDGQLTTWTATTCSGGSGVGSQGSKFKGDIVFAYTGTGGLPHSKTGSITTQVE